MSLVTYQDARPWARSSKQRVAWTDGGAREGNPADFEAKPVAKELYWRGQRDGSGPPDTTSRKALHHSIAYHFLTRERRGGEPEHRSPDLGLRFLVAGDGRPRGASSLTDGMGNRQGLRPLHGRHRQGDQARREDLVGPAHPRGWRSDYRRLDNRQVALPERPGAEEAQRPRPVQRPEERHGRSRHSAALSGAHRRRQRAAREHDHHERPAALPAARQGDAGELPGRADAGHQLREGLQLDDQLHLQG